MHVRLVPAVADERFQARFEACFVGDIEHVLDVMGVPREELESRMGSVGRVRSVEVDAVDAGSVWTELRDRTLHLHALVLDEPFRGRGIGAVVLHLLEDEVDGDADSLELGVEDANVAARRIYERAGFVEVASRPQLGFRILRKPLNGAG